MVNFNIEWLYPWLLLALIPALFFAFFGYFRHAKKYRRNRNRIVSLVLHVIVMVLSIFVLTGMTFSYDVRNLDNEIIILVDKSESGTDNDEDREDYVKDVIYKSGSMFKIGVVTFGYDSIYAAPLSMNVNQVINNYNNANDPDTSATNIADALKYTSTLFTNPQSAKIVLVTDGIETDKEALSVIKSIVAEGIIIDVAHFPHKDAPEAQIVGVELPQKNVRVGDNISFKVSLESSIVSEAALKVYDNGNLISTTTFNTVEGKQELEIVHKFAIPDMHELVFELSAPQGQSGINGDTSDKNNKYTTYMYLEVFENILVLERYEGESSNLKAMVHNNLDLKVVNVLSDEVPTDIDQLRQYDQVIMVNIANSDLPAGFDKILHEYVHDLGGGLLTIGGNKKDEDGNVEYDSNGDVIANAYNRDDMRGTLYQDMLPVRAIDYSPPLGVMIIIDKSGSMSASDPTTGLTALELAKQGAISCLNALSNRDYIGVITLDTYSTEEAQLMPYTQKSKVLLAIDAIEIGGGTVFNGALEHAGRALSALSVVERRHVILVSDGQPSDSFDEYGTTIEQYYKNSGITFSIVTIGANVPNMKQAAEIGGGRYYPLANYDMSTLPDVMREDLNVPEIKAVQPEPFTPSIRGTSAVVAGLKQDDMPELEGYYGTQLKEEAEVMLMGEYVPLYAQWMYGNGQVGSFMCDLEGYWSQSFIDSAAGKTFINNVINALFPYQSVKPKDIDVVFREDNYNTSMSVYTDLNEGETIEVQIVSPPTNLNPEGYTQYINPTAEEGFTRIDFEIKESGIHKVITIKKDAAGNEISRVENYKSFSYSEEYKAFADSTIAYDLVETIADNGNGKVLDKREPMSVFGDFSLYIHQTYDPRLLFLIVAIIAFLLDIAVRKFKFKWPHELVRDYKAKRAMKDEK